MIRMKGDIIRQLNLLYPEVSFKNKFRNDFKNRIIFFFDQVLKEKTLSESLKLSKEYCVIENNEIKLFTEHFLKEHKNDLFNSFNPLWLTPKRIRNQKQEEAIINNKEEEIDISEEFVSFIIKDFLIGKFSSHQIDEDLRYFKTKNHYLGQQLVYSNSVKDTKNLFMHIRYQDFIINHAEYPNTRRNFEEIIGGFKNYNLNSMTPCLHKLYRYIEILLSHNSLFTCYLTKNSFLSLKTKYEHSYSSQDFCLTFNTKEKNFFLWKKTPTESTNYKLIEKIKEDEILNRKEFSNVYSTIEFMILIFKKYNRLKEILRKLVLDDNLIEERKWDTENAPEYIKQLLEKIEKED